MSSIMYENMFSVRQLNIKIFQQMNLECYIGRSKFRKEAGIVYTFIEVATGL